MSVLSSRREFLLSSSCAVAATALSGTRLLAQRTKDIDARIEILPAEPIAIIAPEIYGHCLTHPAGDRPSHPIYYQPSTDRWLAGEIIEAEFLISAIRSESP